MAPAASVSIAQRIPVLTHPTVSAGRRTNWRFTAKVILSLRPITAWSSACSTLRRRPAGSVLCVSSAEANPFMGWRSIRPHFCSSRLLPTQAPGRSCALDCTGKISLRLFPMISTARRKIGRLDAWLSALAVSLQRRRAALPIATIIPNRCHGSMGPIGRPVHRYDSRGSRFRQQLGRTT